MTLTLAQLLPYAAALAVLAATPGPVVAALIARSATGGVRAAVPLASGVAVGDVNDLVTRFFEARKMMKQMAGQFGFGSRSATKRLAKSRKGKKGAKGRPNPRQGPARTPAGMPDLSALPPSLRELPPGLGGMDQLPPGFDPSKLKFPKGK